MTPICNLIYLIIYDDWRSERPSYFLVPIYSYCFVLCFILFQRFSLIASFAVFLVTWPRCFEYYEIIFTSYEEQRCLIGPTAVSGWVQWFVEWIERLPFDAHSNHLMMMMMMMMMMMIMIMMDELLSCHKVQGTARTRDSQMCHAVMSVQWIRL